MTKNPDFYLGLILSKDSFRIKINFHTHFILNLPPVCYAISRTSNRAPSVSLRRSFTKKKNPLKLRVKPHLRQLVPRQTKLRLPPPTQQHPKG